MKESWRNVLRTLKEPKGWILALVYTVTVIICAGSIVLAVLELDKPVLQIFSYICYALAAISLGYSVYTIVLYAPRMKRRITVFIKKFEFGRKMLEHYGFRTVIFAGGALFINVAYVALNVLLAFVFRSIWYGALAGYYGLLTALRSGIVLYHRKKSKTEELDDILARRTEIGKYKTCGIILTIIPICLSFAILQMVTEGRAFVHWGWTSIAFAAFAFYKITMAILNVVRAGKQADFTVQALRNVGLADALVSILALQTSLLYEFSDGSGSAFANALTGAVVCALTLAIGIIMIVKGVKKGKKLQEETGYGKTK